MTTKIKAENIDLSADNLAIGGTSSELFGAAIFNILYSIYIPLSF